MARRSNKKEEIKQEEVSDVEKIQEENAENSDEVVTNEAPKMPEFKKLICKHSFTDKFNAEIVYKVGDELNIIDVARRKDLIERGLAVEE